MLISRRPLLVALLLTWLEMSLVHSDRLGDEGNCPDKPSHNEPCKTIRSWAEFMSVVRDAPKKIVLCPFHINKGAEGPAIITRQVHLSCQVSNQCIIDGGGSHVHVKGGNAKVVISGISFRGATKTAVKVWSSATLRQTICNCEFIRNHASIRGAGLKAEKGTNIYIELSRFDGNQTPSQGGGIYNRGYMTIVRTRFSDNEGRLGGGIRSIAHAHVHLLGNEFIGNKAIGGDKQGPAVYVEDASSLHLLPGNIFSGNDGNCDGVFAADARECITVEAGPSKAPANNPRTGSGDALCSGSPTDIRGTVPRGHFTYNLASTYGPQNWHKIDVSKNNEWTKYRGLPAGKNECGGKLQSPIDLGGRQTANCEAHHEIRTRRGDLGINHNAVTFSITPTRLRIDFERRGVGKRDLPSADLPNGYGKLDANHVEVRTPSEHTFEGKHFDGEYTIAHVQAKLKRIIMVSVLIEASGRHNPSFQILLDKWKSVRDCGLGGRGKRWLESSPRALGRESGDHNNSSSSRSIEGEWPSNYTSTGDGWSVRDLQSSNNRNDEDRFDIYHPDLMPSIHFHAYRGSLTQPPCLQNVHWRVMDEPMVISPAQLGTLAELLSEGVCRDEQAKLGLAGCLFARPVQDFEERQYWRCDRSDFLSDCVRFGRNCD